ncbi:MAG TPA: TIGR01777 family oxidoreductase, partial [Ohtaekwangia sp.]|nr:TIGR01777 family oxidoreductase [Ohtaekwangia sp.]
TRYLNQQGHSVSHLGREKLDQGVPWFQWNIETGMVDRDALKEADVIIHLAGAGIADKRWSEKRKKEILESRTKSTRLLYDVLKEGKHQVKALISASGIGYYGYDVEKEFHESDPSGEGFVAHLVRCWEEEADRIADLGIRVVKIRTGIVLTAEGGALKEMLMPIKFGIGSPLGSGNQYMSWIHIEDLCALYGHAIHDSSMTGAYNGVAPYAVTNQVFTRAIADVICRPLWLPHVPSFVLKIYLGELAELALKGIKISSKKIQDLGFTYKYETLENALRDLLDAKSKEKQNESNK